MAEKITSLYAEIEADTSKLQAGLKAVGDILGYSETQLASLGSATDELSALQNRLALASFDAATATDTLADAYRNLTVNEDPDKTLELEGALLRARVAADEANTAVGALSQQFSDLNSPQQAVTEAIQSATGLLSEFQAALGLVQQGLQTLQGVYQNTIQMTLDYGDQVRDLSRTIGVSAEESSRLVVAAHDVEISHDALTQSLQTAAQNGLDPSIAGLGKLADQYIAIQDPLARAKFLTDNFGQSGANLAPLLEKGSAGVAELGRQADATGQVLSGSALQAQQAYKESTNELKDAWDGFVRTLTTPVIPVLTKLINLQNQNSTDVYLLNEAYKEGRISVHDYNMGILFVEKSMGGLDPTIRLLRAQTIGVSDSFDRATASTKENTGAVQSSAAVNADAARWNGIAALALENQAIKAQAARDAQTELAAGLNGPIGQATKDYASTMASLNADIATTKAELSQALTTAPADTTNIDSLKGHLADLQGQAEEAAKKMHDLSNEFIFQQVSAQLPADAALDLAHHMGLVDDQSYATAQALDIMRNKYDTNHDGAVSAAEGAAAYATDVGRLSDAVARLQDKGVTITVTTIFKEIGSPPTQAAAAASAATAAGSSNYIENLGNPNVPGGANGLDMVVPQGYPNDSYMIAVSSGEHVSVTPASTPSPNNTTLIQNFYVSDDLDVEFVAHRVAALLNS